jgi:hypothetical protein
MVFALAVGSDQLNPTRPIFGIGSVKGVKKLQDILTI